MLVVSKVAISYVVQDDPNSHVPLPPLQPNLICSLENFIIMDELVAYTPHTSLSYEADNAQVYNLFAKYLSGNNSITSITRHQRQRYGRSVFLDLVTHNIGSSKWKKTIEQT